MPDVSGSPAQRAADRIAFRRRTLRSLAAIAVMLGQTEHGAASEVPVAGLDPDEVWKVGEVVSQAVNG